VSRTAGPETEVRSSGHSGPLALPLIASGYAEIAPP